MDECDEVKCTDDSFTGSSSAETNAFTDMSEVWCVRTAVLTYTHTYIHTGRGGSALLRCLFSSYVMPAVCPSDAPHPTMAMWLSTCVWRGGLFALRTAWLCV